MTRIRFIPTVLYRERVSNRPALRREAREIVRKCDFIAVENSRIPNLATFGWEARCEPPAALRFFAARKDAGKPRAFQVPQPVSGQTCPCKPFMGEG